MKRQDKVEHSPSRAQQPEPASGQSAQTAQDRETQHGRASPPLLNRPLSVPADSRVVDDGRSTSPSKSSSLQRYKDMGGIKEKGEKWKERYSEIYPRGESSPDTRKDIS